MESLEETDTDWEKVRQEGGLMPRGMRGYFPGPLTGFIKYLFTQFLTFAANHIGTEVVVDPEARVLLKWSQNQHFDLFMTPDGVAPGTESRIYFACVKTKDGEVIIQVSKQVHDSISFGDAVEAHYQIGRYDDSELNGIRVVLSSY